MLIVPLGVIDKKLRKKKLYIIIGINLESKTLIIFGIKVIVKLGGITYQAKLKIAL